MDESSKYHSRQRRLAVLGRGLMGHLVAKEIGTGTLSLTKYTFIRDKVFYISNLV